MSKPNPKFDRREMPDKNPLTHADVNDLFVFAPTVATVSILVAMTYGLGVVTVRLIIYFLALPPVFQTPLSVFFSLVYVLLALLIVRQDNGVETPTDWL